MTESAAAYRQAVRERHRADVITRIADRVATGALAELPDVFLILINRALDRDLPGIAELSRPPFVFYRSPTP